MIASKIACPECGVILKSAKSIPVGVSITCPKCKRQFVAEAPANSSPTDGLADTLAHEPAAPPDNGRAAPHDDAIAREFEKLGYTLLGKLGQGGMGVVYKARQIRLNRLVALKMILGGPHAQATEIARFKAEATAIAQLQHTNIVQIYEVGELNGLPYFSLEFVNGPTLAKKLAGTPQPARPAAELVENLARAMSLAHQRGIIHRDLKPSNILLTSAPLDYGPRGSDSQADQLYGIPKITDFGLAKQIDSDSAGLTRTGAFVGTPSYVAPEQAAGKALEIGPGVDVYALGAILYEMLTGRPPFLAGTALETLQQVMSEEPAPPRSLQPFVPRDLETICLKCLQKQPGLRYLTAQALAEDLRRYLNHEPILARPPAPIQRLWKWCVRYPVPASLLVASMLCLGVGFWYLSRLSDNLVHMAALQSAAQQAALLDEVNKSYSDVAKRAKAGKLSVTHDYASNPQAIPIPATFTIELGQQISDSSDSGVQVRLYSEYPFKFRRNGGPKDDFEREAVTRLTEDPKTPFYRFEEYKGRPSLRYATARLMQEACVNCHNTHPDSPKTDWEVGQLRGVVEIIHPLDRDTARAREGLQGATLFMSAIGASMLGLAGLGLLVGRLRKGTNALT
jgi:serine/threonine protein kinase